MAILARIAVRRVPERPVSRRPTLAVLVTALLGAVVVVPSHAASAATVPSSHVETCRASGLDGAARMTLLTTRTGRDRSGTHASFVKAWVYAVAGSDLRCVVARLDGARVERKPGRTATYSVGHLALRSGLVVVDTGEVLPVSGEPVGSSGSIGSTRGIGLVTEVIDLEETDTIPAAAVDFLPPELAGLAGHDVTLTTDTLEVVMTATSWTESLRARPMTASQARKRRAAEVARARTIRDSQMAAAAAARDATLAQAAGATGLTAGWLRFSADQEFVLATEAARAAFATSKRMARDHARLAREGVEVRQAYEHEARVAVPLV